MRLSEFLPSAHILLGVEWKSKKRVFETVAILFENTCGMARERVFRMLIERERLGATTLGGGSAIPHGRLEGIDKPLCALMRLIEPIQYGAKDEDGGRVQTLFFLAVPEDANKMHLALLGRISEMLTDESFAMDLSKCANSQAARDLIIRWEGDREDNETLDDESNDNGGGKTIKSALS